MKQHLHVHLMCLHVLNVNILKVIVNTNPMLAAFRDISGTVGRATMQTELEGDLGIATHTN